MVSYNCPKCNTSFNRKSNYERHLNKKFNCNQDIIEYKKSFFVSNKKNKKRIASFFNILLDSDYSLFM